MKIVYTMGIRKYRYNKPPGRSIKLTGGDARIAKRKKHAARHKVYYYVKTGRLTKLSCEYADCKTVESEAHHADYNLALDVIWLCRKHHQELHTYS